MYNEFIDKLQSSCHSNRPVRELWTEADHNTRTSGSLVCYKGHPLLLECGDNCIQPFSELVVIPQECDPPRWTRVVNSHVVGALLERLLEIATVPVNFKEPRYGLMSYI